MKLHKRIVICDRCKKRLYVSSIVFKNRLVFCCGKLIDDNSYDSIKSKNELES